MNPNTILTVVEMLKVEGKIEPGLLDEFVHATASEIATYINNLGAATQVKFLLENNWSGEDILFKAKEKREEER